MKKPKRLLIELTQILVLIIILCDNTAYGQSRQGLPTYKISNDLSFTIGQVDKASSPSILGYEINFWVLPYLNASGTSQFLNVSSDIQLSIKYDSVLQYLGFQLIQLSGNFSGSGSVPQIMNSIWINMNLRVYYGNYVQLDAWQGNNWYELNPNIKIMYQNTSVPLYNDTSLWILQTPSTFGVSIAEMRIFQLQPNQAWGLYMRQYTTTTPSKFNYTVGSIYFENGMACYQSGPIPSYDFTNVTFQSFPITRCAFGKALQSDGTCSQNCLTTKCQVCQTIDKKYFNLCRYCDPLSSSCLAVANCPTDYYLENGVCYKCPTGCSSCTSATSCNTCDSGLMLRSTPVYSYTLVPYGVNCVNGTSGNTCLNQVYQSTTTICDCPDGSFSTVVTALDTLTCSKCDDLCATCSNTGTNCTSCPAPRFLYGNLCITNCSSMSPNLYGEESNRTCNQCPLNCSECTSPTGCTNCKNGTFNGTSLQLLNFAGVCLNSCPQNSIPQLAQRLCDKCANNCISCNNTVNNCTGCQNDYNLFVNNSVGTCIQTCPSGWFSRNGVCQKCDVSCVLCDAENFCTVCTYNPNNVSEQYFFVNYQCKLTCPQKYYPDSTNSPTIFCRNCPSNCLNCTSQSTCTVCSNNYYLTTQGSQTLCVQPQYCPDGQYPSSSSNPLRCVNCKSNCALCTNGSDCQQCNDGYVLNTLAQTCVSSCPTTYYPLPNATCSNCISNCDSCSDSFTCDTCSAGFYQQEGTKSCVASCTAGYYLNATTSQCKFCKPECSSCTSANVCTGCNLGYTLSSSLCVKNCGNGLRQGFEQCDDGNSVSGDGCSADCMIENGFVCSQGTLKDTCTSNPGLISSVWSDFWGSIVLTFNSPLYYSANASKSDNPFDFCSQILETSVINLLGSYYECSLSINGFNSSVIKIDLGSDSTLGDNSIKYNTSISFIDGAISVIGGKTQGIPTAYIIQNLPLDSPFVIFSLSSGTNNIGGCSSDLTINLVQSKGLTKRNIKVVWTLISTNPSDMTLLSSIQSNILNGCANLISCTIDKATIQTIGSKTLTIKAQITNFLGQSGSNITNITFAGSKKLEILEIPDVLNLQISSANQLYPKFRIPYCSYDSTANKSLEQASITYTCEIYPTNNVNQRTSLTSCIVPANYMNITQTYWLRINATLPGYSSYASSKLVFIQPDSPPIQVAYIQGCNRDFNPDNSFSLTAIYNTLPSQASFVWSCIQPVIGSTCFTRNQQYVSFGITDTITISPNLFNYGWQYQFTVIAFDSVSKTNSTLSCLMQATQKSDKVLDLIIVSEQSQTGYVDYSRAMNSFKAYILNIRQVNQSSLQFTWQITDSNGESFDNSDLSLYQNSVGIKTSLLSKNSQYRIQVQANDGTYYGTASQVFQSLPGISNEFRVEPSIGNALDTVFTLSVSSQMTYENLNQYVYGYYDPADGTSKMAMTSKTYQKSVQFVLPQPPNSGTSLTCYVDVIQPNHLSKTYTKTITLSSTTMTASTFNTQVQNAVMDDLIESMQIKSKLSALSSQLTVSDKSAAIKKILQGLQTETTPLSDYYIQSSVSQLLEYISTQTDALTADGSIVTQAAAIFNQITITENKLINSGLYSQFMKASTQSLFNFANNIFQKDFSSQIGQKSQLDMKTNLMKGLKNLLKGSLSNSILGDEGGFAYQGQNMYAKAVKFDSLERSYQVVAKLPKSLNGTLTQNYVGISLPKQGSSSNPCNNYPACQVSIIILDQPVNPFISNSKDSQLKSMFVDISIQSTEVVSPNPQIVIQDLSVAGLTDPIEITVPLTTALNTSNPNRTLGCGYLDEADQIFKSDGLKIQKTTNSLVKCQAQHLTAIGVEEYTSDITDDSTDTDVITDVPLSDDVKQGLEVNMWKSWAIYVSFVMLILLVLGLLWTYRKDKRDQINNNTVRSDKDKLYLGVFLDPIVYASKEQKQDTEKLVKTTHQLEKEQKRQGFPEQQYEQLNIDPNDTLRPSVLQGIQMPQANTMIPPQNPPIVMNPPPQINHEEDFFGVDHDGGMNNTGMSKKSKKIVKKKKKKKKGGASEAASNLGDDNFEQTINNFRQNGMFGSNNRQNVNEPQPEHNIFFEGGEDEEEIEFGVEFEGGSEEGDMNMTGGIDAAAESIKSRRSKKKAKKKRATSSRRGSIGAFSQDNRTDGEDAQVEDVDEGNKSARSDKSGKSAGGKKKKKKNTSRRNSANKSQDFPKPDLKQDFDEENDVKFNSNIGAGGFGLKRDATDLFKEEDLEKQSQMNNTNKSSKSGKKKKGKKKKGSRAGSRASSRSSNESFDGNNQEKPDYEAEEIIINSKRRNNMEMTNKSDLLKPVIDKKKNKKPITDNALDATADKHNLQNDLAGLNHQTKGFDTLMADDYNHNKPNLDGVKQASTKKPQRRNNAVVRPRRFQKEQAGCCVFYCWNCKESHRLCALYRHYNDYLSRSSRLLLLIMSLFMYIMISGFMIKGNELIGPKTSRGEQFACGLFTALFSKIWIILLTNLMRHTRREKIYLENYNMVRARRLVQFNQVRFWLGVALASITILISIIYVFILSSEFTKNMLTSWGWAFLFSMIGDFAFVEGFILLVQTVQTLIVGSAPDSCGKCRNYWLETILQSIKDTVK